MLAAEQVTAAGCSVADRAAVMRGPLDLPVHAWPVCHAMPWCQLAVLRHWHTVQLVQVGFPS